MQQFFQADKQAFAQAVKPIMGIVVPTANDSSRYLNVRTAEGKLSIFAVRQDVAAMVVIEDGSLFSYPKESEGKVVAFDPCLGDLLEKHDINDVFTVGGGGRSCSRG